MDPRTVKIFTLKWQEAMPLVLAQEGYEIHLDLSNKKMVQTNFQSSYDRSIRRSFKWKHQQYAQWLTSLYISWKFLEALERINQFQFQETKELVKKLFQDHWRL